MIKSKAEVWRTYPEFPFIQGSNFESVRTIDRVTVDKMGRKQPVKGHVLKQYHSRNGYMKVYFGVNGKTVSKSVHRIIASCFIPNPDSLPEVNHKNCVRDDNRPSNLGWCSRSYNCQYREKYGVSMTKARGHSLWAVDLETEKKLHFRSQAEAGRILGIDNRKICAVIKGKRKTTGGYWFTEDESKISKDKLREIKVGMWCKRSVIAVDLKTYNILWFKSQYEAERNLGVNQASINRILKGKQKTAGGYWFTYDDDNTTSVIKNKFGDKVKI